MIIKVEELLKIPVPNIEKIYNKTIERINKEIIKARKKNKNSIVFELPKIFNDELRLKISRDLGSAGYIAHITVERVRYLYDERSYSLNINWEG